jgi:hypothetical protein
MDSFAPLDETAQGCTGSRLIIAMATLNVAAYGQVYLWKRHPAASFVNTSQRQAINTPKPNFVDVEFFPLVVIVQLRRTAMTSFLIGLSR